MLKTKIYLLLFIALLSCKTQKQNNVTTVAIPKKSATKYSLDTDKSTLGWKGSKVITGSHTGTIDISEGALWVSKGKITAGNFTIDMKTIKNTDLEDADTKAKLVGHLSSPDFFNVDSFPTSYFAITKAIANEPDILENIYIISGNLTIKNTTKEITFPAKVSLEANSLTANANIKINRMDWNVNWGNENDKNLSAMLKENFISNTIELTILLIATPTKN